MNKKKLLIATSTFPRTIDDAVSARFVFDLARALTAYYEVSVIVPHSPGTAHLEDMDSVTVHRFSYFFPKGLQLLTTGEGILANIERNRLLLLQLPFLFFFEIVNLIRIAKAEDIEVVNTHWIIPQGLVAALVKRLLKVRHILTVHAADIFTLKRWGKLGKALSRFILRRTDVVMPVSNYIKDMVKEVSGADFKYKVTSMGVDLKRFTPPTERKERIFTYLFVGKLIEKKGLRFLLEAVKEIRQKPDSFRLLVAGGGPLLEKMREYAASLGIADRVEFKGWVSNARLPEVYYESDIVVVPSVFDSKGETEGMPTVIAEAMACGIPVVASAISGVTDVVKDGYNGWLTLPGDKDDLAEKMRLACHSKTLPEYRRNCIETAAGHSWEKKADSYHKALEQG